MSRVRASAIAAVAGLALAGCGSRAATSRSTSNTSTRAASTTISRADRPPATGTLVLFKRVVSADPLSSQLTIDRDGWATATLTLGGPQGRKSYDFRLEAPALRRLRAQLHSVRLRDTPADDSRHYIYWLSTGGHTWQFEQIHLTAGPRRLVSELNRLLDDHTHYNTGPVRRTAKSG